MRIELPGVRRNANAISFDFDGTNVSAAPGESIAAALIAAGHWDFRQSHWSANRRGIFCGMGVCASCAILVDGVARRACMEPARAGQVVRRHPSRTPIAHPGAALLEETLTPDLLVIGAGPAGLAAARAAAEAGLDVLIVDERSTPGGQFFKQPNTGFQIVPEKIDAQFKQGRALIESTLRSGAKFIPKTSVWGAFTPTQLAAKATLGEICATTPEKKLRIRPRSLILAPGAYERAVPFPGWDQLGVITTGAAQSLLRANLVTPGSRILIAGNGPLNLQVAHELTRAGAKVVAVAEAAAAPSIASLAPLARMTMTSPGLVFKGASDYAALLRRGVKIWNRHAISRVSASQGSTAKPLLLATITRIDDNGHPIAGSEHQFEVDSVCTGYGFLPQSELARALGCRHSYDPRRGSLVVERDQDCRTSVDGVYVAGDAGGLGGAYVAISQGTSAGLAAARALGATLSSAAERELRAARQTQARHARFQAALWSLYAAPLLVDQLAQDDTPICRCEGVKKSTLLNLATEDVCSAGSLKRGTRAGMGRCQGRYCGPIIAEMMRRRSGAALTESDFFAPRTPYRPTSIEAMAASSTRTEQADSPQAAACLEPGSP